MQTPPRTSSRRCMVFLLNVDDLDDRADARKINASRTGSVDEHRAGRTSCVPLHEHRGSGTHSLEGPVPAKDRTLEGLGRRRG